MMARALRRFFAPPPLREEAQRAYLALVAQSRQPFFYETCAVPDTLDGRFDMLALHMFLALHRLRHEETPEVMEFTRALQEAFFADMDRSLREMGSTDTGTGRRVKNMAQAFYGRVRAYEESLANPAAFQEALRRNLYREREIAETVLESLAQYARQNAEHLARQSSADLMSGVIRFLG